MIGSHAIHLDYEGRQVPTLEDILPAAGQLRMLIVGETPTAMSISVGHYFQGRHGKFLWSQLKQAGILSVPAGEYEDDHLISHGFGITDVVKHTDPPGREPTPLDYKRELPRFFHILARHQPEILFFVYKRVLDNILRISFKAPRAGYGFFDDPKQLFPCKVFVFCMMGTPCDVELRRRTIAELTAALRQSDPGQPQTT
jgi:uracil-DNA glycosylase